jgi:two-component system, NarL family, sensor histidine kinase DegS
MMTTGDLPVYDTTDQGIRLIEEAYRRIARDLHDGPAQQLTNLSMRLDIIPRMMDNDTEMAKRELARINTNVIQTINEIRRLLFDLRPLAIDEIGLVKAVIELSEKFQRDYGLNVRVDVETDITNLITPAKQVAVYRLIQEILNNTKKHAQANQVQILFTCTPDGEIEIQVEDDGIGFDPNKVAVGHFGLLGMKERATYLGGTLDIQSTVDEGSYFTIRLPGRKQDPLGE